MSNLDNEIFLWHFNMPVFFFIPHYVSHNYRYVCQGCVLEWVKGKSVHHLVILGNEK